MRWKSKFNAIKVTDSNGVKYDSRSEYEFSVRYPSYAKNEKDFIVWEGAATGEKIVAVPDFVKDKLWIEIKSRMTYKEKSYKLKKLLIEEYCKVNGIKYVVLIFDNNNFMTPEVFFEVKRLKNALKKHKLAKNTEKMLKYEEKLKEIMEKVVRFNKKT